MEGNKKKIIIVVVIAVLLIAGYLYWKSKQEAPEATTISDNESLPNPKGSSDTMSVFPLKMGSRNPQVKSLQTWLLKNEGAQIKIDGIWGSETDAAVNKFLKMDSVSKDKYASMGLK